MTWRELHKKRFWTISIQEDGDISTFFTISDNSFDVLFPDGELSQDRILAEFFLDREINNLLIYDLESDELIEIEDGTVYHYAR
jgi:hypothetical protein